MKLMSKIEDKIKAEELVAWRAARAKEKADMEAQSRKWWAWVEEEKPRIAAFKRLVNKHFPCLEGDFEVKPRNTVGYLEGEFKAELVIRSRRLEISLLSEGKKSEKKFVLFMPSSGRNDRDRFELESNADLEKRIREFIIQRDYEEERAQKYYDSLPIGNTD